MIASGEASGDEANERVLAGSVRRRAIPAAGSLSLGGGEGDGVRLPGGTKV
jgi:hypothetical protein